MAGFPDDHGTWREIAPRFASTHTIITLCMPDYDQGALASYWGYPFGTIVKMMDRSIDHNVSADQPITLVAHDWGAYIAYLYLAMLQKRGDKRVEQFVVLDVGIFNLIQMPLLTQAVIVGYQLWLALCFLVGRLLFTLLGDIMLGVYPWSLIGPTPFETKMPTRTSKVSQVSRSLYRHSSRSIQNLASFD
jgi:pimeloyl-ACP methyl ester carboxylesterase